MLAPPIRCATLPPTMHRSRSLRRSGPTRLTSIGVWDRVIQRAFPMALARSVHNNAPNALAFVHQLESLVDIRQWHGVGDHRIDLDLALHVPIDDALKGRAQFSFLRIVRSTLHRGLQLRAPHSC